MSYRTWQKTTWLYQPVIQLNLWTGIIHHQGCVRGPAADLLVVPYQGDIGKQLALGCELEAAKRNADLTGLGDLPAAVAAGRYPDIVFLDQQQPLITAHL